jgi:hypothetical protein
MGEFAGFATGHPMLALAMLLITAICGILRRWIAHSTTIRHEAEATKRMQLAVGGTSSTERAAVVRACADLEAASHPAPRSRRPRTNQRSVIPCPSPTCPCTYERLGGVQGL